MKKVLKLSNSSWLIDNTGLLSENLGIYSYTSSNVKKKFNNIEQVKEYFNSEILTKTYKLQKPKIELYVRGYPVDFEKPIVSTDDSLPVFYKSKKKLVKYCAGYYYLLKNNKWIVSFCPDKRILENTQYYGPFKTEQEASNKNGKNT